MLLMDVIPKKDTENFGWCLDILIFLWNNPLLLIIFLGLHLIAIFLIKKINNFTKMT